MRLFLEGDLTIRSFGIGFCWDPLCSSALGCPKLAHFESLALLEPGPAQILPVVSVGVEVGLSLFHLLQTELPPTNMVIFEIPFRISGLCLTHSSRCSGVPPLTERTFQFSLSTAWMVESPISKLGVGLDFEVSLLFR